MVCFFYFFFLCNFALNLKLKTMKPVLTILGIFLFLNAFTQQLYNLTPADNIPYAINNANTSYEVSLWPNDENYASSAAAAATDVVLWSDDFANGLDGNNSSTVQTWTVAGSNNDLWEHDMDGSGGPFAGATPLTLDSETKANGWMIFDADKGNINLPQSAFQKKQGELISPSIDLSNDTNVTLKFTHMYRYCCGSDHKLKIYVYDGSNWSNGIDVSIGSSVNNIEPTSDVELNISQYAALKSDVKIKFSWEADEAEAYYWMIDDVKILETNAYDANLLAANHVTPTVGYGGTTYRLMNLEQAEQTAYYFSGVLQNSGYNNIDSTRIYAYIDAQSGAYQSNGVVSIPTETDTLYTVQGFTPSAIGNYTANVYGGNDNNQFNTDTTQLGFEITQYEYGKDNGNYNQGNFGRYPLNDEGTYEIGSRFMIYKNAEIQAVKIRLDQRTGADAKGKIIIYEILNDGSSNFLYESQEENLAQARGSWYNFKFSNPTSLSADVGYMVMLHSAAATSPTDTIFVSTGGSVQPQECFVQDIDGVNGTSGTWYYMTSAPCLRLNFEAQIGIEETLNLTKFNIFPNPNNGRFTLSLKTESSENLRLNIQNLLGQVVYAEQLSNVTNLNKEINLSKLEKGLYLVNILSENRTSSTQKVVIQ